MAPLSYEIDCFKLSKFESLIVTFLLGGLLGTFGTESDVDDDFCYEDMNGRDDHSLIVTRKQRQAISEPD